MLSRLLSIFTQRAPEQVPVAMVASQGADPLGQPEDKALAMLFAGVEIELRAAGYLV